MKEMICGLARSFRYAAEGVWHTIRTERNFRIHLVAAITVYYLASFYHFTAAEMVLLNITVALVLFGELVNTAVETLVDLVTKEQHHLAKRAKDVAAGAVLVNAGIAVATACFLFLKKEVLLHIWEEFNVSPWHYLLLAVYIIAAILFVKGRKRR